MRLIWSWYRLDLIRKKIVLSYLNLVSSIFIWSHLALPFMMRLIFELADLDSRDDSLHLFQVYFERTSFVSLVFQMFHTEDSLRPVQSTRFLVLGILFYAEPDGRWKVQLRSSETSLHVRLSTWPSLVQLHLIRNQSKRLCGELQVLRYKQTRSLECQVIPYKRMQRYFLGFIEQ